jgi:cytochrome b561
MERNHDLPSTLNYNGIAISLHWLIALFIDGGFYLGTSWQRSSIS